jgi:hypothetical protein
VVSRRLLTGKLDAPPPRRTPPRRGWPPKKGALLGAPKTLARNRAGWQPHPPQAGARVQVWPGWWHAVLPGRFIRVGVVRRPTSPPARQPGPRKPLPPVEAVFTTDLTLSLDAIRAQDGERWAIEITLRDSHAFAGFGHDQGRKCERVVGATTLRLLRAAARTLWVVEHSTQTPAIELRRYRPWDRQQVAPSHLAIVWTWREALHAAGIFPIPRFASARAEIPQGAEKALPLAA